MKDNTNCQHNNTHVSRARGTKVRRKCNDCGYLGKWEKDSGPIAVAVSGQVIDVTPEEDVDLFTFKMDDLREMAKRKGLTGYSKMNKATLVSELANA